MFCPLVPYSSRANETPVSSPVSNGQSVCFCWVSHYCDYSCTCMWHGHLFLYLVLGGFILISFFVWSICGFCTYLPTSGLIYAFCVFLLLLGIMFPFSLQVLLVVIWFMTIRFLYVLVRTVYLKVGLICYFLCNPRNLAYFFCLLCVVFCHLIIVLVWCLHPVYFCLMGCFCLHRAFLVTHVRDWLKKKFTITLFSTIVDKHLSIFQF